MRAVTVVFVLEVHDEVDELELEAAIEDAVVQFEDVSARTAAQAIRAS